MSSMGCREPGYLQKNNARFGSWNSDSRAKLGQIHQQIEPYGPAQYGFVKARLRAISSTTMPT